MTCVSIFACSSDRRRRRPHGIFFWSRSHHLVCHHCSHRTDRARGLFHDLGREPVRYHTVGLWPQLVLGCFPLFRHVDLDRCQTLARRWNCHDNLAHHQHHTHCDRPGRHSQIQYRWQDRFRTHHHTHRLAIRLVRLAHLVGVHRLRILLCLRNHLNLGSQCPLYRRTHLDPRQTRLGHHQNRLLDHL